MYSHILGTIKYGYYYNKNDLNQLLASKLWNLNFIILGTSQYSNPLDKTISYLQDLLNKSNSFLKVHMEIIKQQDYNNITSYWLHLTFYWKNVIIDSNYIKNAKI